ncbi:MAG: hypothetical protein AAF583_01920 [Pseudomonadota bacterium]
MPQRCAASTNGLVHKLSPAVVVPILVADDRGAAVGADQRHGRLKR